MIQIEDVRKFFGRVPAVDGISFTAPDGCITGLVGPNGLGKTTTLVYRSLNFITNAPSVART